LTWCNSDSQYEDRCVIVPHFGEWCDFICVTCNETDRIGINLERLKTLELCRYFILLIISALLIASINTVKKIENDKTFLKFPLHWIRVYLSHFLVSGKSLGIFWIFLRTLFYLQRTSIHWKECIKFNINCIII